MPYNITIQFADGEPHTYQNVPEDVTPDQIEQRATKDFPDRKLSHIAREAAGGAQTPAAAPDKKPKDRGLAQKVIDTSVAALHSITDPVLNLATGAIAKPVADIAGLAATGKEMISPDPSNPTNPEEFRQHIQESLTYQPRHGGETTTKIAQLPGQALGYVAGKARQVTEALGGSRAAASGVEEAVGQAAGFLGAKGAPKAAAKFGQQATAEQALLYLKKGEDAPLNAIRKQSRESGLITSSPNKTPGVLGKLLPLDEAKSKKNAETATRMAAEEIGVPRGAALTPETLSSLKQQHYKSYSDVIDAAGGADARMPITPEFTQRIQGMVGEVKKSIAHNPVTFAPLADTVPLLESQLKGEFDPAMTMKEIRTLRAEASKTGRSAVYSPAEAEKAAAKLAIANELEGLFEANIKDPALLAKFRESRTKLAQIHVIEGALDPAGRVSAQKIAAASKKFPLTGKLKVLSDHAKMFPDTVRPVRAETAAPGLWDALFHPVATVAGVGAKAATSALPLGSREPSYRAGTLRRDVAGAAGKVSLTAAEQAANAREADRLARQRELAKRRRDARQ
jgi:hypothetical protein